ALRDFEAHALEDFGAILEGGAEVLDMQAHVWKVGGWNWRDGNQWVFGSSPRRVISTSLMRVPGGRSRTSARSMPGLNFTSWMWPVTSSWKWPCSSRF